MRRKFYFLKEHDVYKNRSTDIDPDEIFLDSQNLPQFDVNQFEGRMEKSISTKTVIGVGIVFLLIFFMYFGKAFDLEIMQGATYLQKSEANALKSTLVFAQRGILYDRNGIPLAWNVAASSSPEFSLREYSDLPGLAHVLGYVKYPQKDSSGFYYSDALSGVAGVEQFYNSTLSGTNGSKIVEVNADGAVQSESVISPAVDGKNITLSIDANLQSYLYARIASLAQSLGYIGGAGVIMNVHTGEVIAMTSYPEYSSQVMTDGTDTAAIANYNTNPDKPFLDRVINGLYAPGSTVKPYMALAALSENIIASSTKILSTGSISIPNPYDPSVPSVFHDWRPQGWVDMEQAIAVSSDVYFYEVGGGYENQKGLGIDNIDKYMSMFGFGDSLSAGFFSGSAGTVPSPEWKAANFDGQAWNIGDTYHTAIGQYGWQTSPIQMVRAVASLANGGKLINPSILKGGNPDDFTTLNFTPDDFNIVTTGMRMDVEGGVATQLDVPYVSVAAKTGTAQIGTNNQYLNSWVTGFFPYDNPQYAFAVVMEQGASTEDVGGVYVMRQVLDWLHAQNSPYLQD